MAAADGPGVCLCVRVCVCPSVPAEDEMFSDIYKIREVANGLCLEVEGKVSAHTSLFLFRGEVKKLFLVCFFF